MNALANVRNGDLELVSQDEAEVDRAVTEANVFALASHQYWGTWALLQACSRGMCCYDLQELALESI